MDQKRPKKVFIAEDKALIRSDLVKLLTEEGFEIVGQVADDREAAKFTRRLESDLVTIDVKMPDMSGITAAEIIGEERIAPVLMLTAFSQSELVEQAYDASVTGYLVKPFGVSEMIPATEVVVGCFAELRAIEKELASLKDRPESREIIDQTKRILQEGLGLTELEAFRRIQKTTMDLRKSMCEAAEGAISYK